MGVTKYEWTYDDNGNQTNSIIYSWRNDRWEVLNKSDDIYDEKGNRTSSTRYMWSNDNWDGLKFEYTYDDNDNQTSVVSYHWQDDQWVMTSYQIYYYSNDPVGISTPTTITAKTRKVFRDGKLFIETNNRTYTITGIRAE